LYNFYSNKLSWLELSSRAHYRLELFKPSSLMAWAHSSRLASHQANLNVAWLGLSSARLENLQAGSACAELYMYVTRK